MAGIKIYPSINDILGPSENRFFSSGYRRSECRITDLILCASGEREYCFEAIASISYPKDWSIKEHSMDMRPHLSTIDMLTLSIKMIETYLMGCFDQSSTDVNRISFRELSIHAGNKPQENLDNIPITVKLRCSEPTKDDPSRCISTYECHAGYLRAVCQVEYSCGKTKSGIFKYCSINNISDDIRSSYYDRGYKEQMHIISDVKLDIENMIATSNVEIVVNRKQRYDSWPETVSYIDAFVICSQLAQSLLYSLDNVTRDETSTLWMIRTHFSETLQCAEKTLKAKAIISSSLIIELNGNRWRNAEVVGTLGNKIVKITFAHALPRGANLYK